jgi:uncharacterized protein (TIGR01777 family)
MPFRQVQWDGRSVGDWASELENAIVINLAGELVDRRPTPQNIKILKRSRVEPTRALVEASKLCQRPPVLWLQASSTAIYGDAGDVVITEDSPLPDGPPQMTGVARPWEEAAEDARADRKVILRTSLVLDTDTPVLDRLTTLVRLGLGGRISTGRQWVSWIHIEDFLRSLRFLIAGDLNGIVNVTSPGPIQNEELMRELRRHLKRPWSPPAPAPLVRIGAWAMRSDPALALTGRRCIPKKLVEAGFAFEYPELASALDALLGDPKKGGPRPVS